MDKNPLTGVFPHYPRLKLRRPTRWALVSLLALLALLGLIILWNLNDVSLERHPQIQSETQSEAQSKTIKYSDEHIYWEPCGDLKGDTLECSSIDVPIDQFAENPSPDPNKNFTIPLMRLRGANATQNLLLNPGGPGHGGLDMLYRRGSQLKTIVGEGFHLLTFDPRGVNSSTPTASCYPDDETRRRLSSSEILNPIVEGATIYAWAKNFARACPDTMGDYAPYINTPQTAADMNSILDAVGQRDMIYWGFSYGSLLGQTYAGLFPERSKRVVIDGIINQFKWYDGVFELESQVDTDKVLEGFFEECQKADVENCPLTDLTRSKSPSVLGQIVRSYLDELKHQPLNVYINSSVHGILDYDKVWYNGIFPALHNPSGWGFLAVVLHTLIRGNAKHAFREFGTYRDRRDESNDFVTLNDGLSGPDNWPQSRDDMMDWMLPYLFNNSLTANGAHLFFVKQQWKVPRTHSYVPQRGVETAHPLLILSTTYDPVTPLVSAVSANEAFLGSQIVEVEGYGHCSVAVASVCLVKHLRAFLYEGILPSNYTNCQVDSPYFIRPDENMRFLTQVHFEDAEDQKIHVAQLELMTGLEVIVQAAK